MYSYYQLYKNNKAPVPYRIEMIQYAAQYGNKKAAKEFQTSVKTIRKWKRRFEQGKKPALKDQSRRPKKSPDQMIPYWRFKINDICQTAKKKNKRINAALIQRKYKIPYSTNTILKIMRETGFLPQKRRKAQRKRDLREIKQNLKPFEKIQVDIKYLDDIPEFYPFYLRYRIPKYQITARDVRTGALFYSYAMEKSSTNTSLFLLRLGEHLKAHGIQLNQIIIQTDNGSEFTTPWNSIKDSAFTKVVKYLWQSKHKKIPPGAKTWQSDVETSHRLIEDEFYAFEEFNTTRHFYGKAAQYQKWFNLERYNSYKKGTPLQILKQAYGEDFDPKILVFKPILIDIIYRQYKNLIRALAA